MDFASLPPEINSGRMYVGPGSAPMLAAAAAWDTLAGELHSAASLYQSVVAALTSGPWLGPASGAMTAAAAPYLEWMRAAAAQAEETATHAKEAVVAYETAFAEMVPPPVIAANRALLTALVATNIFGQNTASIAATEAQYAEMWAQDTSAMQGYAGASASATTLTPFNSPSPNTDSSGTAAQAAAVTQATGTSAGNVQGAVSNVTQALAAIPDALNSLATPAATSAATLSPLDLLNVVSDLSSLLIDPTTGAGGLAVDSTALPYDVVGALTGFHTDDIVSGWAGTEPFPGTEPVPPSPFPVITNLGSPVAAGMGEANIVGKLSVPPGWAAAAPEIRLATTVLPATAVGAAAQVSAGGAGSLFSQMALAGMAGRAMAGTTGTAAGATGRKERIGAPTKKPGEPAEPAAAARTPMGGPITSIAAELRELASLRDSGILTEEEFTEQKRRLL
ncbi:MAG: PPE domain-containing protein, partial [Mycobacterium sp.]|uniref:PPE family protein, SVP subgroup n=1 Tax=Mycobacterium sp. TaxID=1785 RepID=UPI001EC1B14B